MDKATDSKVTVKTTVNVPVKQKIHFNRATTARLAGYFR